MSRKKRSTFRRKNHVSPHLVVMKTPIGKMPGGYGKPSVAIWRGRDARIVDAMKRSLARSAAGRYAW